MSPITLYLVLKYLVDIWSLTPLILSKTTKKGPFWAVFLQSRPHFDSYRSNYWSDQLLTYFGTFPDKFPFDPYIYDVYLTNRLP